MEGFLVVAILAMDHVPLHLANDLASARNYAQYVARSPGELIDLVCKRLNLTQSPWEGDVAIYSFDAHGMLSSVEHVSRDD